MMVIVIVVVIVMHAVETIERARHTQRAGRPAGDKPFGDHANNEIGRWTGVLRALNRSGLRR